MFLYQVIDNTNETVLVSHAMMKAVNLAYISMVHDNFKNITVWKDGNIKGIITEDMFDEFKTRKSMLEAIKKIKNKK